MNQLHVVVDPWLQRIELLPHPQDVPIMSYNLPRNKFAQTLMKSTAQCL